MVIEIPIPRRVVYDAFKYGAENYDYREASTSPTILVQPQNTIFFEGFSGSLTVDSNNSTNFQWQVSNDGGSNYTDTLDGALYAGSTNKILTDINAGFSLDNFKYRVLLSYEANVCDPDKFTNAVVVQVRVKTVISKRKQTYRVNKGIP